MTCYRIGKDEKRSGMNISGYICAHIGNQKKESLINDTMRLNWQMENRLVIFISYFSNAFSSFLKFNFVLHQQFENKKSSG
mmetsp:Transcript_33918/g.34153  ORF Transcript_33918/g.34153 Transcript_33918/m.34153 type:complete len:81 (-) Transcript_33918:439-681(-)